MIDDLAEVQAAVRRVRGVAWARVRWPIRTGPATLEVRFREDADRERATAEVLEVLRAAGRIDVAVDTSPSPAPIAAPRGRAAFRGIALERGLGDVRARATLLLDDVESVGSAYGLAAPDAPVRLSAVAAVDALNAAHAPTLRFDLVRAARIDYPDDTAVVHVVVCLTDGTGVEQLLGAAIVRSSDEEAAVRATLDATNRRVDRHFSAAPADAPAQPPM